MSSSLVAAATDRSSGKYYERIAGLIGLMPLRRQPLASRLMAWPGLQTAPMSTPYGRWVIIPSSPSTWSPAYGLKEEDVQVHLARSLDRADAFIDCGANLGWYALQASRRPQIRSVLAVEPARRCVQYMQLIRALNGLDRLQIVEGCVTTDDGPASFCFTEGAFSEHGYVPAQGDESPGASSVRGYTLETLLQRLDPASRSACVKIDVEGHERGVLESARPATLHERVASIIVEVHLYKFPDPYDELRRICELVTPVGRPRFLLNAPALYPGYRRLWRHALRRYPLSHMSLDELCALIERYRPPDLFVLAQRGGR